MRILQGRGEFFVPLLLGGEVLIKINRWWPGVELIRHLGDGGHRVNAHEYQGIRGTQATLHVLKSMIENLSRVPLLS